MLACLNKKMKYFETTKILIEYLTENSFLEILKEKGPRDKTILHFACEEGGLEIVKLLLSIPDIDLVNVFDKDSRNPLISSLVFHHFEIFEYIIHNSQIKILQSDFSKLIDIGTSVGYERERISALLEFDEKNNKLT